MLKECKQKTLIKQNHHQTRASGVWDCISASVFPRLQTFYLLFKHDWSTLLRWEMRTLLLPKSCLVATSHVYRDQEYRIWQCICDHATSSAVISRDCPLVAPDVHCIQFILNTASPYAFNRKRSVCVFDGIRNHTVSIYKHLVYCNTVTLPSRATSCVYIRAAETSVQEIKHYEEIIIWCFFSCWWAVCGGVGLCVCNISKCWGWFINTLWANHIAALTAEPIAVEHDDHSLTDDWGSWGREHTAEADDV